MEVDYICWKAYSTADLVRLDWIDSRLVSLTVAMPEIHGRRLHLWCAISTRNACCMQVRLLSKITAVLNQHALPVFCMALSIIWYTCMSPLHARIFPRTVTVELSTLTDFIKMSGPTCYWYCEGFLLGTQTMEWIFPKDRGYPAREVVYHSNTHW